MPVDAVENALVGCQVKRDERKDGRKGRRVEFGVDAQLILRDGQDASEALLLLEQRGPKVYQF